MRICGIEFKGSEARLAVIEVIGGTKTSFDLATKKIPLWTSQTLLDT